MRMSVAALAISLMAWASSAHAAVRTETIEYRHGETLLEGYLAYDEVVQGPRPGILVVHEWKGLGSYVKGRAEQLAQLGYVAFAADMYGKGVRAKDHQEAAALAGLYRRDRALMRGRIVAALDALKASASVDPGRLAAIGYCFGGTTVLELARSGADVAGVVSFHGALDTPSPGETRSVRASILVLHGSDDPHVPASQVSAFEQEMRQAGADYRVIRYEGAVHSFTVPEAGQDPSAGVAYHPEADHRSWEAMQRFFEEIFGRPETRNVG